MSRVRLGVIPLVVCTGLFLAPTPARSPGPTTARAAAPDSLDDGPHVLWQDGKQPIVFYLCGREIPMARPSPRDTITFTGFCTDSTTEYRVPTRPPTPDRDTWKNVPRILALSDIHGEYDAMVTFLQQAGVVDSAGHWTWGDGHLVIVGDVVDRGNRVTECLWFLYRLEREAARAGGRLHMVLGNHELMVMRDDLRYVNEKYTEGIVRYAGMHYRDLFGPDMELGRWLRSKPFVLKLNDIIFVHGGLAPELVTRGLSISKLNTIARASIDISSVALVFSDLPSLLFGSTGPLWYRGYLFAQNGRYTATTDEELDAVLRYYGASTIVVGHTDIGQLMRLHDGKVFAIDVSLEDLGAYQGLLWEKGTFSLVTGAGTVVPFE